MTSVSPHHCLRSASRLCLPARAYFLMRPQRLTRFYPSH
jgi:hypothetical protein